MHESSNSAPAKEPVAPPPLGEIAADVNRWALFLDFDGTLVELAETPEAIRVPAGLPDLLRALSERFSGAVAVVTGRSLDNLDRHLGVRLPAAGQHGVQWRATPADIAQARSTPALDAAREQMRELTATWPRLLVEDKGATLAVHYRGVPEAEPGLRQAMASLVEASDNALEVLMGKNVCELRPSGINKGSAISRLLETPRFAGRLPLVIGDDVTDEAAFEVALDAGGAAVKVGSGDSRARWRLQDPLRVREWLTDRGGSQR